MGCDVVKALSQTGVALMTAPRQLAIVTDYDGLIQALRNRCDELEMTREGLDREMHTLPDGYASKLLAPVPIRALGKVSLGPMLQCLGIALVVIEDLSAMKRIEKRAIRQRAAKDANGTMQTEKRKTKRGFRGGSEQGRLLRARGILALDPAKRRRIARKAARMRWAKHRAARRVPATGA
jgi:hypothetical protein